MKLNIVSGAIKTIGSGKRLFEGSFIGDDGNEFNATIWETDKDNKQFPGFNDLRVGSIIDGTTWTSPTTGKVSIYPPKVTTGRTGGGAAITKAMEVKNENIKDAQERKDIAIRLSGSMTSAVQLAIAEVGTNSEPKRMEMAILRWRNWLLNNHGDLKDVIDPTK